MSGKVDPENCRVEGIDTAEEKAEKEVLTVGITFVNISRLLIFYDSS